MTKESFKSIVKDYYNAMPKKGYAGFMFFDCPVKYTKVKDNAIRIMIYPVNLDGDEEIPIEEIYTFYFEKEYTKIFSKYENKNNNLLELFYWNDIEKNNPEYFDEWYLVIKFTIEI